MFSTNSSHKMKFWNKIWRTNSAQDRDLPALSHWGKMNSMNKNHFTRKPISCRRKNTKLVQMKFFEFIWKTHTIKAHPFKYTLCVYITTICVEFCLSLCAFFPHCLFRSGSHAKTHVLNPHNFLSSHNTKLTCDFPATVNILCAENKTHKYTPTERGYYILWHARKPMSGFRKLTQKKCIHSFW